MKGHQPYHGYLSPLKASFSQTSPPTPRTGSSCKGAAESWRQAETGHSLSKDLGYRVAMPSRVPVFGSRANHPKSVSF